MSNSKAYLLQYYLMHSYAIAWFLLKYMLKEWIEIFTKKEFVEQIKVFSERITYVSGLKVVVIR